MNLAGFSRPFSHLGCYMKKKVLDVSGDTNTPLMKKKAKVDTESKKEKVKKSKKEEVKTKAEKAHDLPVVQKKRKKKGKKSIAELLVSDKDQALARIEQHASIAGIVVHPDDLAAVENPEAVFLLTYQKIFRRLRKFSRKMERTMGRKDKDIQSRDVYALNVLYNQTREVMADMRSLIDMGTLAETLCSESLDPMAKTSAQAVTTMLMSVQATIREVCPQYLETIMVALKKSGAEIGTDLNNQLTASRSRLTGILTQSR